MVFPVIQKLLMSYQVVFQPLLVLNLSIIEMSGLFTNH
jgi:hypothetical protein